MGGSVSEQKIGEIEKNISALKKENEKLRNKIEVNDANIKVNYIYTLLIAIVYLFSKELFDRGTLVIVSPMQVTAIFTAGLTLFMWKDILVYAKHITKKMMGVK